MKKRKSGLVVVPVLILMGLLTACGGGRSNPLRGTLMQQLEQSEEGAVTFLWFEIGDYWPSESSYTNFKACYFGATTSFFAPAGTLDEDNREELLDEEGTTRQEVFNVDVDGDGDWRGRDWQVFDVEDYTVLVTHDLIDPMPDNPNPDQTAIGYYLCGNDPANGQYGVLEEPEIAFVKEGGVIFEEEPENVFVANDRYGYWCYEADDGTFVQLNSGEEPPVGKTAERCYHQKPGGSTSYFWYTHGGYWYRGPRRCYYCTDTNWTGGSVAPQRSIAQANSTTGSTLTRGPGGIATGGRGAGTGSGK